MARAVALLLQRRSPFGATLVALVSSLLGQVFIQSWMPAALATILLVVIASVVLAHELGLVALPLPQNARQVPERVVEAGPRSGALQFGIEMGTGMRTFMTSSQPHLLISAVVLVASPVEALAAGVGFGLGRSMVPVSRQVTGLHESWSESFAARYRTIRIVTFIALCGSIAGAVGAAT